LSLLYFQIKFECGGDLPFCGVGLNGEAKCTNVHDEECGPAVSDFECLAEGVFPDPSDCKKYYVCSDSGEGELIADEYFCDNYYVFDPSAPNNDYCRFTRNFYCITANCQGQVKNILMNYPFLGRGRGQVVASCRGSKKPLIFRCGEGFTAKLNSIPVECELTCRGAGKFEYVEDSMKYYDCIWTGRGWEAKIKSCFRNYYFDKTKKQCVVNPTTAAPSTTTQSKILVLFRFNC
jgi:hypothetical protein